MKWLLLLSLLLWAVTGYGFWSARNAGDNFGAIFWFLAPGAAAMIVTLAYVIAAIWTHRLW